MTHEEPAALCNVKEHEKTPNAIQDWEGILVLTSDPGEVACPGCIKWLPHLKALEGTKP